MSNQDPTTPTGNIWLANYALHLETERTTRSVSSTDAFVGLRIRCVGNSFAIAAQLLDPTEPSNPSGRKGSSLGECRPRHLGDEPRVLRLELRQRSPNLVHPLTAIT